MVLGEVGREGPGDHEDRAGSEFWRNWRAACEGRPRLAAHEHAIFSDAHVTGELLEGLGPYQVFNALGSIDGMGVALVLRAEMHTDFPLRPEDWQRSDTTHWVGYAPLSDHLASLLSLSTGARFRSGGYVRDFDNEDNDPRGRPTFIFFRPASLPPTEHPALLPDLPKTVALGQGEAERLRRFASLHATPATKLLRSARQYRQALWVAESDPEFAWLMLIGALETGAECWGGTVPDPVQRLENADAELVNLLREVADQKALEAVARKLAPSLKVGARLREFVGVYDPGPPPVRPAESDQTDWSQLQKSVNTLYGHRSSYLHAGVPLPAPLYERPRAFESEVPCERPLGLATYVGNTTWTAKDVPMLLHTFAYLVRGVLLRWWDEQDVASGATSG